MKILMTLIFIAFSQTSLAFGEKAELYKCHFTGFLAETNSVHFREGYIFKRAYGSNESTLLELRLPLSLDIKKRARVEFFDRVFGEHLVMTIYNESNGLEEMVTDMVPLYNGFDVSTISAGDAEGSFKLTCSLTRII